MKVKMVGWGRGICVYLGGDIKFIVGSLEYIVIDDEFQSMCVYKLFDVFQWRLWIVFGVGGRFTFLSKTP